METTSPNKVNTSLLKPGDVFSRFSCGTVVAVDAGSVVLKNTEGLEWTITKEIIEAEFQFADHETSDVVSISRTEMIDITKSCSRVAMKITFNKKLDHKEAAAALESGRAPGESDRAWNKRVKEALTGEERTIRGYHKGAFDSHQRLHFIEIGGAGGMSRHRLVDLRTVSYLVVDNQSYKVK